MSFHSITPPLTSGLWAGRRQNQWTSLWQLGWWLVQDGGFVGDVQVIQDLLLLLQLLHFPVYFGVQFLQLLFRVLLLHVVFILAADGKIFVRVITTGNGDRLFLLTDAVQSRTLQLLWGILAEAQLFAFVITLFFFHYGLLVDWFGSWSRFEARLLWSRRLRS